MILEGKPHGESGKVQIHPEDAMRYIVDAMAKDLSTFKGYGYDLYVRTAAERYAATVDGFTEHSATQTRMYQISGVFFDAAWELCRRGILRPGVRGWGEQMTDDGSAGNGYCITPFGRDWLKSEDRNLFVPTEPERFAVLLDKYKSHFGPGFHQRAQEALRCYSANAYLASCAMSGAAAESILLATACGIKDADFVMKEYRSQSGRKKVENIILAGKDERLRSDFSALLVLLKYWRDNASHGTVSEISNEEAFVALATLLRLAQFVDDKWKTLVEK